MSEDDPAKLRERAHQYRGLALSIGHGQAFRGLIALAEQSEDEATRLERMNTRIDFCHRRAEEVRAVAKTMTNDPQLRDQMLEVAMQYEDLAVIAYRDGMARF